MSSNQPTSTQKPMDKSTMLMVCLAIVFGLLFIYLAVRINQGNVDLAAQKAETQKLVEEAKAQGREAVMAAERKAMQQVGAALTATLDPLLYQHKPGESTLQDAVDRAASSGLFELILVADPTGKTIAASNRMFMSQQAEGILVDTDKVSETSEGITGTFPVKHGESKMGFVRLVVSRR